MSTDAKKYTTGWLYGSLVVGVAFGAIIYYFLKPDPCKDCCVEDPKDPPALTMTGFFDSASIESIMSTTDSWGGRFYLCKHEGGGLTVLGGAIQEDGAHIPDASGALRFMAFKSISGSSTDMTELDEARAEAAVKAAGTPEKPTWAIAVDNETLKELLSVTDANAIGFQARRTSSKNHSFELGPVKLSSDAAYAVGVPDDVLLGAYPCPMLCPKEPSLYLHLR
ncbi:MAG: hypothetical protein IPJ85_12285 [Flavobacteriales bacterium]|nr:hypothetical protein [Flavobacteriales bacterium]